MRVGGLCPSTLRQLQRGGPFSAFERRPGEGRHLVTGCPAAGATMAPVVRRLLLASPRGYCAGVERAVDTVKRALELHGAPVYVRRQIVHNVHVVNELEARGAVFVE